MYLVFRKSKGCKQYIFETADEIVKYFSKKCYKDEIFKVIHPDNTFEVLHYEELSESLS